MRHNEDLIQQAKLLIYRLERISADSIWAHRSSGQRGALLRWVARLEGGDPHETILSPESEEYRRFAYLIQSGYELLEKAAKEMLR